MWSVSSPTTLTIFPPPRNRSPAGAEFVVYWPHEKRTNLQLLPPPFRRPCAWRACRADLHGRPARLEQKAQTNPMEDKNVRNRP